MFRAPQGERIFGIQLPVQSQSSYLVQPWERAAGPAEMALVAKAADEHGYAWLGASDHITIPESAKDTVGTFWSDGMGVLDWVAGQTTRIRLLTYVYVLPYRHPLAAAKQFATLDWLSGGRAIAGLGAGHVEAEFDRLGVDFAGRGRTLDEGIGLLQRALQHEFVDGMGARPRPVQQPRPPIWVSGSSNAAIRRAARLADGWLPQGPATGEMVQLLLDTLHAAGRSTDGFVIGHVAPLAYVGTPTWDIRPDAVSGSAEQVAETLLASAPVGVNQLHVRLCTRSADELCDQLAAFATDVAPLVRPIG
jgi:probable F420-dependent oxidoreductase